MKASCDPKKGEGVKKGHHESFMRPKKRRRGKETVTMKASCDPKTGVGVKKGHHESFMRPEKRRRSKKRSP